MSARWVAALVLAMGIGARVHAQPAQPNLDDYDNAIRAYLTGGNLPAALKPLRAFMREHFDAAAQRIAASGDRGRIDAAAMFQLEMGVGIMVVAPTEASEHFALGRWLLEQLEPSSEAPGPMLAFNTIRATWFGVAGSAFLAVSDTANARSWVTRALALRPGSPALMTLQGATHELDAMAIAPELLRTGGQRTRALIARGRHYALAAHSFREALKSDPNHTPAEIRLGRVLFLLDEVGEAQAVLERAESRAQQPADRYLSALFLGNLHERRGNVAAARGAYERALAVAPRSQTAVVALGHLETMSGGVDRARTIAQSHFESATVDDRFWRAYRKGGVDEVGLMALRRRFIRR